MKFIPKSDLLLRESGPVYFKGAKIWLEQLDELSVHGDVVLGKFQKDMCLIRMPGTPELVAVDLTGTQVSVEIAERLVGELAKYDKTVRQVAFIGLNRAGKFLIGQAVAGIAGSVSFCYSFHTDCEKAKNWLVGHSF